MERAKLRSSIESLDTVLSPYRELSSYKDNTVGWNLEVLESVITSMSKSIDAVPSVLESAFAVPHLNIFVDPVHQATVLSANIQTDEQAFIAAELDYFVETLLEELKAESDIDFVQRVMQIIPNMSYGIQMKELMQVKQDSEETGGT